MEHKIAYLEYNIILEYLLNIFMDKIKSNDIKIEAIFDFMPNGGSLYPINKNDEIYDMQRFLLWSWFLVNIDYRGHKLWMFFRAIVKEKDNAGSKPFAEYYIDYAKQINGKIDLEFDLISILKKKAIASSRFNGKVLRIKDSQDYLSVLDLVEIIKPANISPNDIFIPEQKKEYIDLFIKTLTNYKEQNLRYLFNGRPGTAKTQIIHSIMNQTSGKATFLVLENRNIPMNEIFNFCSMFLPCVLVIDDLDLLIDERGHILSKNELSAFLSNLDGFNYKNLFILATTNDKKLVDIAAQRPGRFNLIINSRRNQS